MDINKNKPILVTGATGYVAGWLVKRLLDEGLTVHAAVRDPDNQAKIQHLVDMAEQSNGEIVFFKADLLNSGSYKDAMQNCQIVFHTASPFSLHVKDAQTDLVDPAKLGTRNVLEQACDTPSVERVVLTSSVAAMYGDNADLLEMENNTLTEEYWNSSSSVNHQPYSFSKAEAEKEAWKIAQQQSQWDLVCINPCLVIGPSTNPKATSASFEIIRRLGNGAMKQGCPKIGIGLVDVRDVAQAHFAAGFTKTAQGRYIISSKNSDLVEIGQTLAKHFPAYPLPRKSIPKFVAWLFGPIFDKSVTRPVVARNADHPWVADNSKSIAELGMSYRDFESSLTEMFQQLIDTGILKKR